MALHIQPYSASHKKGQCSKPQEDYFCGPTSATSAAGWDFPQAIAAADTGTWLETLAGLSRLWWSGTTKFGVRLSSLCPKWLHFGGRFLRWSIPWRMSEPDIGMSLGHFGSLEKCRFPLYFLTFVLRGGMRFFRSPTSIRGMALTRTSKDL